MVITTVSKAVNAGNAFKYSAINPRHEIRILILEPGTERDKIKCNLVHASLTDRPYEALSYEWGFQQEDEPEIILDGFSRRVRNNLFNALRQIRPEDGARHLWTDALCINKADGEEKIKCNLWGRFIAMRAQSWCGLDSRMTTQPPCSGIISPYPSRGRAIWRQ